MLYPVPVEWAEFCSLVVGRLGAKRGALSLSLYLIAGGLGFPVFVGGNSGLAYLSGMTFGYLLGFIVAAYVVGRLIEIFEANTWAQSFSLFGGNDADLIWGGLDGLFQGVEKALVWRLLSLRRLVTIWAADFSVRN